MEISGITVLILVDDTWDETVFACAADTSIAIAVDAEPVLLFATFACAAKRRSVAIDITSPDESGG
jgi:hypothetical protein